MSRHIYVDGTIRRAALENKICSYYTLPINWVQKMLIKIIICLEMKTKANMNNEKTAKYVCLIYK